MSTLISKDQAKQLSSLIVLLSYDLYKHAGIWVFLIKWCVCGFSFTNTL